jgi:hypothetical protein
MPSATVKSLMGHRQEWSCFLAELVGFQSSRGGALFASRRGVPSTGTRQTLTVDGVGARFDSAEHIGRFRTAAPNSAGDFGSRVRQRQPAAIRSVMFVLHGTVCIYRSE